MRFIRRKLGLVAVGLALGSSGPAMAHHSFAMFDHTKNVTLDGTVKAFTWQNPHIWIQVLAPQAPGGTVVDWTIEGGSVNILARRGWAATVVKPGDKVTVVMNPLRSGVTGGSLISMTVGGKTLFGH